MMRELKKKDSVKNSISIELGMATAFIALVVATTIVMSLFISYSAKQTMRTDLQKQLHNVVAVGSLQLDGEELQLLIKEGLTGNEAIYEKHRRQLQAIRDSAVGVRHVYTLQLIGNEEVRFIVDAEEQTVDMSYHGQLLTEPPRLLVDTFFVERATGFNSAQALRGSKGIDAIVHPDFVTDQWGTWLSGYAPIYSEDGSVIAIIGADITAQNIVDYERRMIMGIVGAGFIIAIFMSFFAIQITKFITRPLKVLEQDMLLVRDLQLDSELDNKTIFREIISVNSAVDKMKLGLRAFKKYVPETLVKQLITVHQEATLSMERKHLTIFFSDVANFTSISEEMQLEDLQECLDTYMTNLSKIIHGKKGTIDKYIGDSIMAFWGAPLDLEHDALLACQAALACQTYVQQFNQVLLAKGNRPFTTRIGIHSGEVLVGNVGADDRLNYTVMGDPVNVASRLEALNKSYGTQILISETTYKQVADQMQATPLGKVSVRGRTTEMTIYELTGEKADSV